MQMPICSADTRLKEHRDALVLVESTGEVRWLPQAIFKSTCNIDITNFPFDVQKCSMKFGSWTYDGFKLDVNFLDHKDQFDISDYVRSNEWELLEYPAVKHTIYYYGLDEPYPDLTFYVIIKRVAVTYNYILVLPCVLLSFLTLVIFWLPPESPAKVMIGWLFLDRAFSTPIIFHLIDRHHVPVVILNCCSKAAWFVAH